MYRLCNICFLLVIFVSCQNQDLTIKDPIEEGHLKYFGFTLIDTFWDDPLDSDTKTNYLDEVAAFTNIADLLVVQPSDKIIDRLSFMQVNKVKAILHVNELFFENVGTGGPSGLKYSLRTDYKERWDIFVMTNDLNSTKSTIGVFYLGEEPTWNGISFAELKAASDYIKSSISDIPIMLVEAYTTVNQLKVPSSIDWIGFDHYFIKDPKNNPAFLNELSIIKSKLSTENQHIVLIMDSHFIEEGHGDFGGINKNEMGIVANSYYELALSEPKVVALIGYTWPGGFDTPTMLGARQFPQHIKDEYRRIGKEITKK